jgi:IS630-spn1, transposase orf1
VRVALKKLGYTRKKTDKIEGAGREKSKCIFKKIIRSKFRQRNNLY